MPGPAEPNVRRMSGVRAQIISKEEAGLRLDRWFRRHFPELAHGRLEKLLRTGQIRVDGARAKSGDRLDEGQTVRIPPLPATDTPKPPPTRQANAADRAFLNGLILHADSDILVLDKPAGLAVQGGTGTHRHLDGLLSALSQGDERLRLVHRLDRDTSGVILLARSAAAADRLAQAFRKREPEKVYWAVTAGLPSTLAGTIDLALSKLPGRGVHGAHERVVPVDDDESGAKRAI